jgi:hypothetical protein
MTFAGALALLAVLGKFYAKPLMADVKSALVQDVDNPGRNPFQATVTVNVNNFTYTPVPIPAGKRLVVDYISMSGAAQTTGEDIQPIVILSAAVAGSPNALYYIAPEQSGTVPGQFYHTQQAAIYADSLGVGPAFSGFTPSFMTFSVVISGHLISLP